MVFFVIVNTIGMLAFAFKGIGKFAVTMLPWQLSAQTEGLLSNENLYAILILLLTSIYVIKGGMVSNVVITEVMQFTILTITSILIGLIANYKVSPEVVHIAVPDGWFNPFFGWKLGLDWKGIFDSVNDSIRIDGNEWFGIVFGLMFFKGILGSLAGPAPNYDMQRVLRYAEPAPGLHDERDGLLRALFSSLHDDRRHHALRAGLCLPELRAMEKPDFERLLPIVLTKSVPAGVVGLMLAGLLAAFMSNFAATINAAPAYLVNDVYKRFINPNSSGKTDVWMSRAASIAVLAVGILFGLSVGRITQVMLWITGALYGGYVMANVLKWIWWRFNGYGYFWGLMAGIVGAMVIPEFAPQIAAQLFSPDTAAVVTSNPIYLVPPLLVLSFAGCLVGTYLSEPEDAAILKHFYRTTRPWGFWGPIRDEVIREDPGFQPNRDFWKDTVNVLVGIAWQTCLTSLPIFLVLRSWDWALWTFLILAVTTVFIKFNWYDKLPAAEST